MTWLVVGVVSFTIGVVVAFAFDARDRRRRRRQVVSWREMDKLNHR